MDTTEAALEDLFVRVEADLKASRFFGDRAAGLISLFAEWADVVKQHHPDWLTSDEADARLIRRVEAIREPQRTGRLLTAKETAARVGMLDPDGQPSDSFYKNVAPMVGGVKVGSRWTFPEAAIEAFVGGRS
jgi:hypothetical protein